MRRIKDRAVSGLANPVERSHIGHEVVISERNTAFRETEFWIAEGDELVGNISNIPWREKLAFFNIKHATRFRGSAQKVGLPAQKCWDLQHIDLLPGNVGFYWQMDIRCDRNSQFAADGRKNLAALAYANSTKLAHRSPVRLVIGGFKNEIDIFGPADFRNFLCHAPDELLRLDHAWAENEDGAFPADRDFADAQWLRFHSE